MSEERVTEVGGSGAGSNPPRRGRPQATRKVTPPRKATSSAKVTEGELTTALAAVVDVGLSAYFQFLMKVDKQDRDALEMTADEAEAMSAPIAKLIGKSGNGAAAGVLAASTDWIVATAAVMAYADRAGPVLKRHREQRVIENRERHTRKASGNNGSVRQMAQPEQPSYPSGPLGSTPSAGYGLGPQHVTD